MNCLCFVLTVTFVLKPFMVSTLPLSNDDNIFVQEQCIKSVAQIQCTIPSDLVWSCIKPNVIFVKGTSKVHEDDYLSFEHQHNHTMISENTTEQGFRQQPLVVNCTAPFPIDIRISGFHIQEIVRTFYVRNAENVFNEATFVYSVGLRYDPQNHRVKEIMVFKLTDQTATVSFFVFHTNFGQISNTRNHVDEVVVLEQSAGPSTIIPCISPDPTKRPRLVRINESESSNSTIKFGQEIAYDLTHGFRVNNENPTSHKLESYNCFLSADNDTKPMSTIFQIVKRKDLHVHPPFQRVILFQNDDLKLVCRSRNKVQLIGSLHGEGIKPTTTLKFNDIISTLEQKHVQVGDDGTVTCVDEVSNKTLFSWTIETLDIGNNDILRLKKETDSLVSCVSLTSNEQSPPRLMTVFCQGESNCEANKWCFEPNSTCINARMGIPCDSESGGSCLEMNATDPIFSQGMIYCAVGNYSYSSKFFRGFDGVLYLDWKSAPVSALIEVFVPPKELIMYPHNSYPFGCRASPFVSDGKIQWVIRGKDGSEILLHKKRVQDISPKYNLDWRLYTVRESNIRLIYPNDYDILCMVPWWNATGSLRYFKRINVAAPVPPVAPVAEILIGSACIIILLIIPLVIVILRLKKAREAIRNLTEHEVEQFIKGDPSTLNAKDKDAHEKITATPYNQDFEIPRNKLLIDTENKLGEGAFGLVLKGKVEGVSEIVAVKTVKPRCEVEQFKGFLSELKIMMFIGRHPYVVGLIGAHTDKIKEKIMYIVVEYCSNGSLDKLLLNSKKTYINQLEEGNRINPDIGCAKEVALYDNLSGNPETLDKNSAYLKTVDLLRWAYQISSAMDYLCNKKVVHADLAARNVLVHENGTAKLTDFGLSRQLMNYTQYVKKHQEPLPWRWMAEESLKSLSFSSASDTWSYGVVLWEMFSIGDIPYPGMSWTINFVDSLSAGLRMTQPNYCPSFIYEMMLNCWHQNPESRPKFKDIAFQFKNLLESLNVKIDATVPPTQPNNIEFTNGIATDKRNTVANLYEN